MSLELATGLAARDLPEGYVIRLCVEKGAAWVEVTSPGGSVVPIDGTDLELFEQMLAALKLVNRPTPPVNQGR